MARHDIIDLVQDSEGVYTPHVEKPIKKSRQKRQKLPIEELAEGYKEGKQVVDGFFKLLGEL